MIFWVDILGRGKDVYTIYYIEYFKHLRFRIRLLPVWESKIRDCQCQYVQVSICIVFIVFGINVGEFSELRGVDWEEEARGFIKLI